MQYIWLIPEAIGTVKGAFYSEGTWYTVFGGYLVQYIWRVPGAPRIRLPRQKKPNCDRLMHVGELSMPSSLSSLSHPCHGCILPVSIRPSSEILHLMEYVCTGLISIWLSVHIFLVCLFQSEYSHVPWLGLFPLDRTFWNHYWCISSLSVCVPLNIPMYLPYVNYIHMNSLILLPMNISLVCLSCSEYSGVLCLNYFHLLKLCNLLACEYLPCLFVLLRIFQHSA